MSKNTPSCYTKDEWERIENQFYKDFRMYNKHIRPFQTLISEILKGETETSFANKTQLSPNMFYRIRTQANRKDPVKKSTLLSVAVGYNLDYQLTVALLESIGAKFILSTPRDYAYQFILINCRGKNIDECNEILKELGLEDNDLLGYHARK